MIGTIMRLIIRWSVEHGFDGNCQCDSDTADRQSRSELAYVDRLSNNDVALSRCIRHAA